MFFVTPIEHIFLGRAVSPVLLEMRLGYSWEERLRGVMCVRRITDASLIFICPFLFLWFAGVGWEDAPVLKWGIFPASGALFLCLLVFVATKMAGEPLLFSDFLKGCEDCCRLVNILGDAAYENRDGVKAMAERYLLRITARQVYLEGHPDRSQEIQKEIDKLRCKFGESHALFRRFGIVDTDWTPYFTIKIAEALRSGSSPWILYELGHEVDFFLRRKFGV